MGEGKKLNRKTFQVPPKNMNDGKRMTYKKRKAINGIPSLYGNITDTMISIKNHWNHLFLINRLGRGCIEVSAAWFTEPCSSRGVREF